MTNARPTVSVVMATYNGEKYIREQIDSILNQTYPIYELIIQDDCSTDSTPAICREYEAKYPCVHFYQNEHNLGFNLNFQTAAMRAKGDFVALSDDDDVWFPKKIEMQVAAIGEHDMCTCAICRGETPDKAVDEPYSNDPRGPLHLFKCILGHTMLLGRDFIQNSGNWQGGLTFDWSLTLHAGWYKGIVKVDEVLVFHRSHPRSFSYQQAQLLKQHSKFAPFINGKKFFQELQSKPKFIEYLKYIFNNTTNAKDKDTKIQHKLVALMLCKRPWDYLRLCFYCMVYRKKIYYPAFKGNGIHGIIRGFFYPGIFACYAPTVLN